METAPTKRRLQLTLQTAYSPPDDAPREWHSLAIAASRPIATTGLPPTGNESLSSADAHRRLREQILTGELAAGDRVPSERTLSEELGVNRHVIREALKRLKQAGLVNVSEGGDTRVLDWRHSAGLDLLLDLMQQSETSPPEHGTARRSEHERQLRELAAAAAGAREELEANVEAEIDRRAAEAVAGIQDHAARVGVEFDRRRADFERQVVTLMAEHEERASVRLAAIVAAAEQRLAAVELAQEREERIRKRTAAAERAAAERVYEAERRLVEVLARIEVIKQRTV